MNEKTICNNCAHCFQPFPSSFSSMGDLRWQCKASPKEEKVSFLTGEAIDEKGFQLCYNVNDGNCSLYEAKTQ